MLLMLTASIVFLRRFSYNALRWVFRPSDLMLLSERERLG